MTYLCLKTRRTSRTTPITAPSAARRSPDAAPYARRAHAHGCNRHGQQPSVPGLRYAPQRRCALLRGLPPRLRGGNVWNCRRPARRARRDGAAPARRDLTPRPRPGTRRPPPGCPCGGPAAPFSDAAPALTPILEVVAVVDPSLYVDPDPSMVLPVGEPPRTFPLDLAENLIGRRSDKRDIHPEVPLTDPASRTATPSSCAAGRRLRPARRRLLQRDSA